MESSWLKGPSNITCTILTQSQLQGVNIPVKCENCETNCVSKNFVAPRLGLLKKKLFCCFPVSERHIKNWRKNKVLKGCSLGIWVWFFSMVHRIFCWLAVFDGAPVTPRKNHISGSFLWPIENMNTSPPNGWEERLFCEFWLQFFSRGQVLLLQWESSWKHWNGVVCLQAYSHCGTWFVSRWIIIAMASARHGIAWLVPKAGFGRGVGGDER